MGFASQAWFLRGLIATPPLTQPTPRLAPALPVANCTPGPVGLRVLSPSNARSTSARRRTRRTRAADNSASLQLSLPLHLVAPESPSPQAAVPGKLRIIQREPSEQAGRMVISGRMADVCAALERMAANED